MITAYFVLLNEGLKRLVRRETLQARPCSTSHLDIDHKQGHGPSSLSESHQTHDRSKWNGYEGENRVGHSLHERMRVRAFSISSYNEFAKLSCHLAIVGIPNVGYGLSILVILRSVIQDITGFFIQLIHLITISHLLVFILFQWSPYISQ